MNLLDRIMHPFSKSTSNKAPVFDHKKITVIFVLGGPGAGKPQTESTGATK